jgi:hypothetical protein
MEGSVIHTIQPESDSDSDDSGDSYSSDEILSSNVGVRYQPIPVTDDVRLLDQTRATHYERFRNTYFTPQITKHNILVDLDSGSGRSDVTTTTVDLHEFGFPLDQVIGFKYVKGLIEFAGAPTQIDIVIPEIPYIACRKNKGGAHIIERIAIYSSTPQYNENKHLFRDIYFTPLKLTTLHIEVSDYDSTTNSFLEFEVTVLNNTNETFPPPVII